MKRRLAHSFLTATFLFGLIGTSAAGDIVGKVNAKRAKFQKDVVVFVDKIDGQTFEPPSEPALMDQRNMVFVPHVLPVLVGTQVNFRNSDEVLHNVFSPDKVADRLNLGTYPQGEVRSKVFDKPGVAVILCNVHPEMEAYVVVLETPYFAVTDEEGNFVIKDVPPGTYTLKVWSEKYDAEAQQVVVEKTKETQVEFRLAK
jgi:plastocyanin